MQYRKKPAMVDAFKWTGGPDQTEDPEWIVEALKKPQFQVGSARIVQVNPDGPINMEIFAHERRYHTQIGDYIIKNSNGEIYSRPADIFEAIYEIAKTCQACNGSGLKTIDNDVQLDDPCDDCWGSGYV